MVDVGSFDSKRKGLLTCVKEVQAALNQCLHERPQLALTLKHLLQFFITGALAWITNVDSLELVDWSMDASSEVGRGVGPVAQSSTRH